MIEEYVGILHVYVLAYRFLPPQYEFCSQLDLLIYIIQIAISETKQKLDPGQLPQD